MFLVSHSIDICTEAMKNIRNIHAVLTNDIASFLHFIDKCSYNLQEIIKVSYIYSRIFENPKVAGLRDYNWTQTQNHLVLKRTGLQLKILLK